MTATLISVTTRVVLGALLAVIVGALAVLTVVPRAVDGAALTVLTGSMTPEIAVGSVVVVRPVDPGTLQVGDVVTYQTAPGKDDYVTHRIIAIDSSTDPVTLTTKGDANRGEDLEPVPVTALRGKVMFSVPYLGSVRNTIGVGGSGLVLLVLALAGYSMTQVASALRDRRRQARTGAAVLVPIATVETMRLQTLAMTLPLSAFDGLRPARVAELLRMDLLDEGPESFTVSVTRETDQIDQLVELLTRFEPLGSVRSEPFELAACPRAADQPDQPRRACHAAA